MIFSGEVIDGCGRATPAMARSKMQTVFRQHLHETIVPGTFNVRTECEVVFGKPHCVVGDRMFYRMTILKPRRINVWLYRNRTSKMPPRVLELISRENLKSYLGAKTGSVVTIEYNVPWLRSEIAEFAKQYKWFHSFDFLPPELQRADSSLQLESMRIPNVWDLTVLDVGGHTGYFSVEFWKRGARPTLLEKDKHVVARAHTILKRIVPADVELIRADIQTYEIPKNYDIVLYMSVHHQFDPTYAELEPMLRKLAEKVDKMFYFEEIIPFKDSLVTVEQVTRMLKRLYWRVKLLVSYEHKIRGTRHIWQCIKRPVAQPVTTTEKTDVASVVTGEQPQNST